MKFNKKIKVYGDMSFRGECPTESAEQITFFNAMRKQYADLAIIATHIRNEGKRTMSQVQKQKAEGMVKGASDVIIPGFPTFCCEIKRKDHTKSRWQSGQQLYLETALSRGAFTCVALGHRAALEAIEDWITYSEKLLQKTSII